jgi:hypothetical protein
MKVSTAAKAVSSGVPHTMLAEAKFPGAVVVVTTALLENVAMVNGAEETRVAVLLRNGFTVCDPNSFFPTSVDANVPEGQVMVFPVALVAHPVAI